VRDEGSGVVEGDVLNWLDGVDWVVAVRGASLGFSVLVIGGLVQPLVAMAVPPLGVVWLLLVAVVAFAVAGRRIGAAVTPALHGAVAAMMGYFLVVPLVYFAQGSVDGAQIGYTFATAAAVGAAVGHLAGRRRARLAEPRA
jgi:Osmosensitive K+ channel histidine kinase